MEMEFRDATPAEVREMTIQTLAGEIQNLSRPEGEKHLAGILAEHGHEVYADVVKEIQRSNALDLRDRGMRMIRDGQRLVALAERQLSELDAG
jgi:hypothetical protein